MEREQAVQRDAPHVLQLDEGTSTSQGTAEQQQQQQQKQQQQHQQQHELQDAPQQGTSQTMEQQTQHQEQQDAQHEGQGHQPQHQQQLQDEAPQQQLTQQTPQPSAEPAGHSSFDDQEGLSSSSHLQPLHKASQSEQLNSSTQQLWPQGISDAWQAQAAAAAAAAVDGQEGVTIEPRDPRQEQQMLEQLTLEQQTPEQRALQDTTTSQPSSTYTAAGTQKEAGTSKQHMLLETVTQQHPPSQAERSTTCSSPFLAQQVDQTTNTHQRAGGSHATDDGARAAADDADDVDDDDGADDDDSELLSACSELQSASSGDSAFTANDSVYTASANATPRSSLDWRSSLDGQPSLEGHMLQEHVNSGMEPALGTADAAVASLPASSTTATPRASDTTRAATAAAAVAQEAAWRPDYTVKVLMVGDSGVGKTALLLRFIDGRFEEKMASTVGVDFAVKRVTLHDTHVKVQIWDTAGQERFRTLTTTFYRGAKGVIFVYDVTRRETLDSLEGTWLTELEAFAPAAEVVKMVVANKVDVGNARQVSWNDGCEFARKHGCLYCETSAKQNIAVGVAFEELVLKILETPSLLEAECWEGSGTTVQLGQQPTHDTATTCYC